MLGLQVSSWISITFDLDKMTLSVKLVMDLCGIKTFRHAFVLSDRPSSREVWTKADVFLEPAAQLAGLAQQPSESIPEHMARYGSARFGLRLRWANLGSCCRKAARDIHNGPFLPDRPEASSSWSSPAEIHFACCNSNLIMLQQHAILSSDRHMKYQYHEVHEAGTTRPLSSLHIQTLLLSSDELPWQGHTEGGGKLYLRTRPSWGFQTSLDVVMFTRPLPVAEPCAAKSQLPPRRSADKTGQQNYHRLEAQALLEVLAEHVLAKARSRLHRRQWVQRPPAQEANQLRTRGQDAGYWTRHSA